ncbi:hypothetical protein P4056_14500 [Pseudomonas aeruginosa]|nr:hypothetical protein [Pseudomonas aeruginosa]
MNLCQALASRDADGNSYYRRLLESDLFSLRIGHAYYYRNYLASKFPELCLTPTWEAISLPAPPASSTRCRNTA